MEKQTAPNIAKNSSELRRMHFERCQKEKEMVKVKLEKDEERKNSQPHSGVLREQKKGSAGTSLQNIKNRQCSKVLNMQDEPATSKKAIKNTKARYEFMGTQVVNTQNKAGISNKSIGCGRDESRQQTASDCKKVMDTQTVLHNSGFQAGKGKSTSNCKGKKIHTDASKPFSPQCGAAGQEKSSTIQLSGQKHGNLDGEPTHQKAEKKQKIIPLCPASSMRALLVKEGLSIEEEDDGDNGYEVNDDEVNGMDNRDNFGDPIQDEDGSEFRDNEVDEDNGADHVEEPNDDGERDERNEEDENQNDNEHAELQNAAAPAEGSAKKKGRGITVCGRAHGRSIDQRPVIELDENGDIKGPPAAVYELSSFLGTMARNARWCPLNYTSWKAIPEKETTIWDYVKAKFDIPDEGRAVCLRIMNDAWRKRKHYLRVHIYNGYQTKKERLKHLPASVPVPHFLELCAYWNRQKTITICTKNARNIKGYKWRHRKGKQRFAVIREKLVSQGYVHFARKSFQGDRQKRNREASSISLLPGALSKTPGSSYIVTASRCVYAFR